MTFNELLMHRENLREVFKKLPVRPIAEAGKEPLKIGDLSRRPNRTTLLTDQIVDYGVAICAACASSINLSFRRKNMLSEVDVQYIGERMADTYKQWSVLDLKCFESMLIGGRLPSMRGGNVEYELVSVDIPTILAKAEVYDRMRPNYGALQGSSPMKKAELKPLSEDKYHRLIDGTPYDFSVPYEDYEQGYTTPSGDPRVNAERYWRGRPYNGQEDFDRFYRTLQEKMNNQPIVKTVNQELNYV